jgi:2-dehydropantoate 2-reductase
MKILVVGLGAVGQVVAAHLQRGGAQVSFYVKEKHASEARRGFTLHSLNKKPDYQLKPAEVITSIAEAVQTKWDFIVVCTSSTALKSTPWLDDLAKAEGTFVCMQPGLEDPEYVRQRVGERVAWFMFPLVAYAEGEGTAFYRPPLMKLPFSGARAKEVVAILNKGGLPSRVSSDVPSEIAFNGPLLEMIVITLELAGWRFAKIDFKRAIAGLRESLAIVSRQRNQSAPFALKLLMPWMLKLARPFLKLAPFDVEHYMQTHFTKVGDQTVAGLDHLIAQGLPAPTLSRMRDDLQKLRAA